MKVITSVSWLLAFLVSFSLQGCGSKPAAKQAQSDDGNAPAYTLNYSDVMEFTRGITTSYTISGGFTDKSAATITVDGLPEGAVYEGETMTWQPSCDLKPENGQFLTGYMIQRLRINLTSAVSDDVVQKPAIVIIHKDGENSPCI